MSYSKVALQAINYITLSAMAPPEAWQLAAKDIFKNNSTSIKKGCPKNAFLGLCEEGLVKGVEKGKYTRSDLNKTYAIKAVEVLKERSKEYKPRELWIEVLKRRGGDVKKVHNSQMDVVLALWNRGLIN